VNDVHIAWLDWIAAQHPALNQGIHAAMTKSDQSYLIDRAVRFLEMQRLFKPTGSLYRHCDPAMSPDVKLVIGRDWGTTPIQK